MIALGVVETPFGGFLLSGVCLSLVGFSSVVCVERGQNKVFKKLTAGN